MLTVVNLLVNCNFFFLIYWALSLQLARANQNSALLC